MAELYLAKDTKRDRLTVIKRILPYLAQEREFVQMFLDEARIASQLHHPNIITVYELGHLEGSIFIAMEYVEGVDLRKIFNEEQKRSSVVPANITAWLVSKLCDGLNYAHNAKGADGKPLQIIHRDVSPQNLMIGYGGQVKLVDFGIAKAGAFMERSKPGVIKGKFLYLSPEQLSQERIDHRADIFALGTMMYEIATGKSPFYKATTEAVIYAIRAEEPPPPHLTRRDFPLGLSKIIMRCLAKDRAKRYQQAGEVHVDLEAWMRAEARTTADDVRAYVARMFGGDDERTSLFIPANARGPNDRMTDRHAARGQQHPAPPVTSPSNPAIGRLPPTDPERTGRGPPASAPQPINDETTRPIAQPALAIGTPTASMINANSVITSPVGRRPTPEPMRTVTGPLRSSHPSSHDDSKTNTGPTEDSRTNTGPTDERTVTGPPEPVRGAPRPAVPPPARVSNPVMQPYAPGQPEPRTQTARPHDLAKAFITAPPVRRPSGEALQPAGSEGEDSTALSGAIRAISGDSLPAPSRTPVTVENRPVSTPRSAQNNPRVPEGIRATRPPPEPVPAPQAQPQARKPTRLDNSAPVPRAPTGAVPARAPTGAVPARHDNGAAPPRAATGAVPARDNGVGSRPTGAVPTRDVAHGKKPTRGDAGAFDVPQQFARESVRGHPPVAPTLPPEPSTKEERPRARTRGSLDDLGPILDQAIPASLERRPSVTFDQEDQVNTQDLRGKQLQLGDSMDAEPSQRMDAPADVDETEGDDELAPGIAERPLLVAALVFVVVLVLGLGGLAIYRYRQNRTPRPPIAEKPVKPEVTSPQNPTPVPVEPPRPVPGDVDETQTVMVRFVAPQGTRLLDQRDNSPLTPNTPYRWNPGRRPVQYRCPKKGRLQAPDVTYNVEVKQGVADQTFTISCK